VSAVAATGTLAGATARAGIDRWLLTAVLMLLVIGIAMVYSSSFAVAHNVFGDDMYFLVRHVIWVSFGLVALVITARVPYQSWQKIAAPFYFMTIALLVLVLVPGIGKENYGATRWFQFGSFFSMQPSELAKLAVVIYLATWIARVGGDIHRLTFGTIPFVMILSVTAGLVLVEPDLGTTLCIVATASAVFFISGANVIHALIGAVAGVFLLINFVLTRGFRADRIEAWLDPWADPGGIGWHTTQTLLALGSGGLAGLGLGASRQKHFWLPNAHTDSVFAVVGEEIGFVGTTLVLVLFLIIAWRGLAIAAGARDPMGRALAAGATLMITSQAMLNMAVVSHLTPNTGVPLPFLSYGGSAMVVSLAAVGIILNVSRSSEPGTRLWQMLLKGAQ
jgi:cell division protein FtsW